MVPAEVTGGKNFEELLIGGFCLCQTDNPEGRVPFELEIRGGGEKSSIRGLLPEIAVNDFAANPKITIITAKRAKKRKEPRKYVVTAHF